MDKRKTKKPGGLEETVEAEICRNCAYGEVRPNFNGVDCRCEESPFFGEVLDDDASCPYHDALEGEETPAAQTPIHAEYGEALKELNQAIHCVEGLATGVLSDLPNIAAAARIAGIELFEELDKLERLRFELFGDFVDWHALAEKISYVEKMKEGNHGREAD